MDYEKKYKEALERAREALNDGTISSNTIAYLQDIFPELKESEDERIRKELISLVKNWDKGGIVSKYTSDANEIKLILAWLEKQNTEMKDVISMDVNSETEWDDIHKFLRMNLDGEKVKLLIIREE